MKSIEIPYFLYLFHVFSTHWYFHQVPSTPDSPVRAGVLRPTHVRSVGVVTTPHLVGFRRVNFGLISGSVQSCGIIVKWYLTWLNFRRVQHPTMKSYANKQRLLNSPITIGIQWYSTNFDPLWCQWVSTSKSSSQMSWRWMWMIPEICKLWL